MDFQNNFEYVPGVHHLSIILKIHQLNTVLYKCSRTKKLFFFQNSENFGLTEEHVLNLPDDAEKRIFAININFVLY